MPGGQQSYHLVQASVQLEHNDIAFADIRTTEDGHRSVFVRYSMIDGRKIVHVNIKYLVGKPCS